ncbi:alpha/beta hydrolase, partial [Streptococcus anginosus]|nr:alpha/beta hydrolase [Streptococcus anginosus]MDX5058887.1 alpha/beta hydrolase [Streptococcus anginosus]
MSVKYKLTEFLFRHTVKPMMKKAIKNPDEYFAKQEKKQKSKLPLEKLHKSYDFEEKCTSGTLYYVVKPKNKVANRLVLYFFGGGYTIPGDSGDFEFAQDMANQSQAEVW